MKAMLEPADVHHRGVRLTSETAEEHDVLERLWLDNGGVALFGRLADGVVEVVVAPSPVPKK